MPPYSLSDMDLRLADKRCSHQPSIFYDDAALVAIVEVQKVTQVEVATGGDQTSIVYVAEAEVLQTHQV